MNEIIVTTKQEIKEIFISCLEAVIPKQKDSPEPPKDRIFFLNDAARYLGLSPQTIYTYTHQNRIPFYKRGKKLYFKETELKDWLNQGKMQTVDEKASETLEKLDKKKGGKNG
jgi:excisionase family DNA binding protein